MREVADGDGRAGGVSAAQVLELSECTRVLTRGPVPMSSLLDTRTTYCDPFHPTRNYPAIRAAFPAVSELWNQTCSNGKNGRSCSPD